MLLMYRPIIFVSSNTWNLVVRYGAQKKEFKSKRKAMEQYYVITKTRNNSIFKSIICERSIPETLMMNAIITNP